MPTTEVGSLVRVLAPQHRHFGRLVEIEDYVSAEDAEDGKTFYWASSQQGVNDLTLNEGEFAVAYSAAEARARKPPTATQIVQGLSLHGDHEVVDVDESETSGAEALCYGTTPDGLRIAFKVTVSDVQQVDF